jgi:YidC/Oxa1 family membrane protein insertase
MPGPVAEAAPLSLSNDSVTLQFDLERGAVSRWQVHGLADERSAGGQDPVDLVGTESALFELDGMVAGRSLSEWERLAGGWVVADHSAKELTLRLEHPDLPVAIRKHWRLHAEPWRAEFSLDWEPRGAGAAVRDLRLSLVPSSSPQSSAGAPNGETPFSETIYLEAGDVRILPANGEAESEPMQNGWVGLQNRYFALMLAPAGRLVDGALLQATSVQTDQATGLTIAVPEGLLTPATQAGTPFQVSWTLFGGPKTVPALRGDGTTRADLRALLYGDQWSAMKYLCLGLMHVLTRLQAAVLNWGLAILLLAVLVRIVLWPVSRNAMRAQAKLAAVQARIAPELREIRARYRGGEQSERILALYAAQGTSPLAGLKPLLIVAIQFPLFIALYHVLGRTFALRDAQFLWIDSLGAPDRLFAFGADLPFFGAYFNALPVLMAAVTFLSIHVSAGRSKDAKTSIGQKLGLVTMTLGFFVLFYDFPSGMVLYWTAANLLHLLGTVWMNRGRAAAAPQAGLPVGG